MAEPAERERGGGADFLGRVVEAAEHGGGILVAADRAGDEDPEVRAWVARVLAAVGGEARAELVTGLLEDDGAEVRAAAAVALGRLGHWPAAPALAARLRDPAWRVRRDAAVALRTLGGPGRMMLERALRDEDTFARDMARQTLDLPEVALPS